ncbi:MAG TPA: ParB/RepB/Spo0J family partition protein [Chloroflexota bacterium]|nr:ParB/RepB/Spo0J family partition protein [Chloroflexota bacterium]
MKSQRGGLGRGLDALIPRGDRGIIHIDVDAIVPNPKQPRDRFDQQSLDELAESIRQHGLLQPLLVSQQEDGYALIAGERRWRAAQAAGLATVPALVREVTPREQLELALVENLQRQDLNPLESAGAYQQLIQDHGLTQDDVAQRVGKNRSTIANTLRLLRLPREALEALNGGLISEGHARALLLCPDAAQQRDLLASVIHDGLSVRQTEARARQMIRDRETARSVPRTDPDVLALQDRLREMLQTKVELHHGPSGGRMVIHYYSNEELEALIRRVSREE